MSYGKLFEMFGIIISIVNMFLATPGWCEVYPGYFHEMRLPFMFHSWLYLTFGIAKQAVVARAGLAGMFGEDVETCEADDVLKDAAVTIISAELMQAFASIRTDKIALRKAVQFATATPEGGPPLRRRGSADVSAEPLHISFAAQVGIFLLFSHGSRCGAARVRQTATAAPGLRRESVVTSWRTAGLMKINPTSPSRAEREIDHGRIAYCNKAS